MAIQKTTEGATEADLEAEIHGALHVAFPWLPDGSIRHQTTFSFSFGHKHITIDGAKGNSEHSRADILLYWDEQPLAVLELKRGGLALDADDDTQGLAYAGVLYPRPPLVVVTNGADVRFLETHTGKEWIPEDRSQLAFTRLVKSASLAATHDLKSAISTLMRSNSAIWAQALRQTSEQNLEDLSGGWNEPLQPYVREFLIPRQATQTVLQKLRDGERLILVEGAPLIGKSNVLRELTERTKDGGNFVTFFVEADAGAGILQQLADTLSEALSWPVNKDDVRNWLLRLSNSAGPVLVLAIDGLDLDNFGRDITDLTSHAFGPSVRLVVALDDTVVDRLVVTSTRRKASAIGRRATRVQISPLDDQEFAAVTRLLWQRRVGITTGGQFSREFRLPWVLRAITSEIVSRPKYADETVAAVIPPLLGLDLMSYARSRFADDELRRLFQATARAVIEDSQDQKRPIPLILESIDVYIVRREILRKFVEHAEIEQLIERGYLRPGQHKSGAPILVVRIPELLASEAANLLAVELVGRARTDAESAANWLSQMAGRLPLGDIVATQALLDAATHHGDLPFSLITALVNSPPRQEDVRPGTTFAMHVSGSGILNVTFREKGTIEIERGGKRRVVHPDPGDEAPVTYANLHSWLVLSHLGGRRFALEDEQHRLLHVDSAILIEVGTCPIVLRGTDPDRDKKGILTHDIVGHGSIVCHEAGIVEPITLSMLRFLGCEEDKAEEWLQEAVRRKSLPLLARIDIALRELSASADVQKAQFSQRMLQDLIEPEMSLIWPLHGPFPNPRATES